MLRPLLTGFAGVRFVAAVQCANPIDDLLRDPAIAHLVEVPIAIDVVGV
jgi:hypothetical protein